MILPTKSFLYRVLIRVPFVLYFIAVSEVRVQGVTYAHISLRD